MSNNAFDRLTELSIRIPGLEPRVDGTPIKGAGWEEIASALGHVSREGSDLVRAVYLHEADSLRRTRDRLMEIGWRYGMGEALREALVMATLHAFVSMRPCRFCHGEGRIRHAAHETLDAESGEWTSHKAKWEDCEACGGDGFDHVSASQVQLMLHVGVEVWDMLLRDAYHEMYHWLREQHDEARNILMRKVGVNRKRK